MRPNLFLVGAPKCGTTSVFHWLGQHRDVFVPRIKEPNFFAPDLAIRSFPEIDGEDAYLALFEGAGARYRLDASQFHLYSREAAARIRAFAPEARILILLREPVAQMRSLHAQYLKTRDEDVADFAEAVGLEAARLAGRAIPAATLFPRCMAYRDVVTFAPQVARYLEAFPAEQVLVTLLDDIRADAGAAFRRILAFLDLPEQPVDLAAHNVAPGGEALDPVLADRLARAVAPDIRRLERLVGRDLSTWRRAHRRPALRRLAELLGV